MYINKGIYTYIPIPDPETPKPEPRIPTGVPGYWRTIVRVVVPGSSGKIPGRKSAQGCLPGNQRPGTITRTILRVIPKTRENPNQNTICAWESRSQPDITRTIYRLIDPEAGPSPAGRRKKRGWGADTHPAQASGLLDGLLIIVRYRILFGFCGIFCGCYVNHAIFSTIHKFLKLFYDLLSAEIVNMFVCYMATSDH